jgi:CRISPR system Cascade subunit CasD
MATRVDHEGFFSTDFQTSLNVAKANGNSGDTVISRKHFLADASFTVALAGEYEFLNKLHLALNAPVWPLFLGRKAFVPGVPPFVKDGLLKDQTDPLGALKAFPIDKKTLSADMVSTFRFVVECPDGAEIRNDFPLSFEPRNFASRRVSTLFINIKA